MMDVSSLQPRGIKIHFFFRSLLFLYQYSECFVRIGWEKTWQRKKNKHWLLWINFFQTNAKPIINECRFFIRLFFYFYSRSKIIMARSGFHGTEFEKVALVIGNDRYSRSENRLKHSQHNAEEVEKKLRSLAFQVQTDFNLKSKDDMVESVQQFIRGKKNAKLVLFYFSGHGCQFNDKNYLLPVGDQNWNAKDIEDSAYGVQQIIKRVHQENSAATILLILDCCRRYQFQDNTTAQST